VHAPVRAKSLNFVGLVELKPVLAATGGTIVGTPLAIAASGEAVSSTRFTYPVPASGAFANTITAATSAGILYTAGPGNQLAALQS
jgi:hypothetical protein